MRCRDTLTANVGLFSQYVFRGLAQTNARLEPDYSASKHGPIGLARRRAGRETVRRHVECRAARLGAHGDGGTLGEGDGVAARSSPSSAAMPPGGVNGEAVTVALGGMWWPPRT